MKRKTYPTAKPFPTFPLTPRADGRYGKKIKGENHVFGSNGDWRGALDEYLSIARALHADAIVPEHRPKPRRPPSIQQVVNRYLEVRRRDVAAGGIELRTWGDYRDALRHFLDVVVRGTPATEIRGEHLDRFGRHVREKLKLGHSRYHLYRASVRAFLRYAFDAGWLPPFPLGVHFKRIPKSKIRKARKSRMVEPAHLRTLLSAADGQMKAMLLLALNGGMGNTDCATLERAAVDLKAGVIDYRRRKTGVVRVVPLWAETVDALRATWGERPIDPLVFRTKYGNPWVRAVVNAKGKVINNDSIARAFADLAESFCLADDRPERRKQFSDAYPGVGFYWLRHIHRTISDEARDPHASMRIVGHSFPGMSDVYVEDISIERLRAVVAHVHSWVFGQT